MTATFDAVELCCAGDSGVATKKSDTKVIRVPRDVAELVEKLAPIFGESAPDFVGNRLRPILEGLRAEAADRLLGTPRRRKNAHGS